MISDLEIAQLCDAIYGRGPDPGWDHLDDGSLDDGVCWGIKNLGGIMVVVFRGSLTLEDWMRDVAAAFWIDRDVGPVHIGFFMGVKDVWEELQTLLSVPWVVAGHSLGAARALDLAAVAAAAGCAPAAVVTYGSPRPGFQRMADILAKARVQVRSYRNADHRGHDLVTDVPLPLIPLFPYTHPGEMIDVPEGPLPGDDGPFAYHHIQLYVAAMMKLNPMPTIGGTS